MVEDVLIAYNDSSAETSRRFFQDCADRVRQKTCEKGLNHQMIDATELTVGHIEKRLSRCSAHFIFSAFSHGSKTSLYNDVEDEYIAVALGNNHLFTGNIVYTFACECGCDLKDDLEAKGVASFWGYKRKVTMSFCREFVDCAVADIEFLLEKKTLKEAKKGMADKYDECIAELSVSDPLRASFLLDNKESLVVTGRDELTIDNL